MSSWSSSPPTPQLLALRSLVVLPGALVEGALAVMLPWLVARASLGTSWLGLLSASLVIAALMGTLAAPLATKRWGSHRVVLVGAFASATGLGVSAALWIFGFAVPAFVVALFAIAADGMADIAFGARMPVMARLARVPLSQFTNANWLWNVCGLALGSGLAGIAMGDGTRESSSVAWLAGSIAVLSLLVATALALLMPRDPRTSHGRRGRPVTHSRLALWNQRTVLLVSLIAGISFLYGPVDNLLAPAHLASNGREASVFGAIMAAGAVGLATGLFLTQALRAERHGMAVLLTGLVGIVGQLALLWWLPGNATLVIVSFVTAAAVAPLLPLLESSALQAVASTQRTLLLAAAATAASVADLVGTALFGTLASAVGTGGALGVAAVLAGLGLLLALPMANKVLPLRTRLGSTV